jgi:predicted nuclease of restriction endonuclease-like RecB superfamily
MLTGPLVLARVSKDRVIPRYLPRDSDHWNGIAESLLMIFREAKGMTRGEIEDEINSLVGEGKATLAQRGLAKVLEDRAEFEVVSEVPPESLRERLFTAAAEARRSLRAAGHRAPFRRDEVIAEVATDFNISPETITTSLFADLKDENRLLSFDDIAAERLVDRYNVALAQAVLLRAVRIDIEVRHLKPARYRQLFRWLKFHRLLYRVEGSMEAGYRITIDGPMSLFSATTKYGLQIAQFLPALLLCENFRLEAELRWGPKREPRGFFLEAKDGLISHYQDSASYTPPELTAFLDRFRQVAPKWTVSESTEIFDLGREGIWIPDYRFVHLPSGTDVFVEVLGFWKRSSLERLLSLLPRLGSTRYLVVLSDRLKVDEDALTELSGPILKYKEIPNAMDVLAALESQLPG